MRGEAPHSQKDCQILVLEMDKVRANPIMDLGQDVLKYGIVGDWSNSVD